MPCNCDHLEPNQYERESRKLMELLSSIGMHKGEIPYYGEVRAIHEHTAMLCEFCQNNDVTKHSLELQIWWRDHKKADKERIERELQEQIEGRERDAVLAKLTLYERKLLGL